MAREYDTNCSSKAIVASIFEWVQNLGIVMKLTILVHYKNKKGAESTSIPELSRWFESCGQKIIRDSPPTVLLYERAQKRFGNAE